jgi:hypothetical protein
VSPNLPGLGPLRTAFSAARDPAAVGSDLERQLGPDERMFVLFFASSRYPLGRVARALADELPSAHTAGCSTAGEVTPAGLVSGSVAAMAFAPPARGAALLVPSLKAFRFEDSSALLQRLAARLGLRPSELSPERHVILTLTDGLSEREEQLVASLGLTAPGIPLVGGSAGDDFHFHETHVALDGQAYAGAAVVALVEPAAAFHAFHVSHYHATGEVLEVTEADPSQRLILSLNGRPAARVYSELTGIPLGQLQDRPVASFPDGILDLGIRLGNQDYVRSVFTARGEALLMGAAVEAGTTLTVMRAGDLVHETAEGLARAIAALDGKPRSLLLFNCGGRLLEARARGLTDQMGEAMSPLPPCGFTTYGEQFGAMHVNHTLTGLVLGEPFQAA